MYPLVTHLVHFCVVQDLKADMYTDNWLSGADSATEATEKFCQARSVFADASMDLTKLVSNSLLITSKLHDIRVGIRVEV